MLHLTDHIDYTSLHDQYKDDISGMIENINTSGFIPATVCTWLRHYERFAEIKETGAGLAVVLNFCSGRHSLDKVHLDINAINSNPYIDEVDYVVDYTSWLNRDRSTTKAKLEDLNYRIEKPVKAILETSAFIGNPNVTLKDLKTLAQKILEYPCIKFLKTSTGKHHSGGASLRATEVLLDAIKESGRKDVGLKVSGGIRTKDQASEFYVMASKYFGDSMRVDQFRIGASQLYDNLIHEFDLEEDPVLDMSNQGAY